MIKRLLASLGIFLTLVALWMSLTRAVQASYCGCEDTSTNAYGELNYPWAVSNPNVNWWTCVNASPSCSSWTNSVDCSFKSCPSWPGSCCNWYQSTAGTSCYGWQPSTTTCNGTTISQSQHCWYNGAGGNYYNYRTFTCPSCTLAYTTPNGFSSPYSSVPVVGTTTTFTATAGNGSNSTQIYYRTSPSGNWVACGSANTSCPSYNGSTTAYDYVCNATKADGSWCSSNPQCKNNGCAAYGAGYCGDAGANLNLSAYSCGGWGTCSSSCGWGTQTKTCTNLSGSNPTPNTIYPSQSCYNTSSVGVITSCTGWSSCSTTCGTGTQSRTCYDACGNTYPQTQSCTNTSSVGTVNPATCGAWSTCSNTCGGTGSQSRTCQDLCGYPVTQTQSCTDASGTAVASCASWSTCSNTCGGTGSQSRTCTTASCGNVTQTQSCTNTSSVGTVNPATCGAWGACSTTCGTGTQSRSCQDYCGNPVTQTQSCTNTSSVGTVNPATCGAWGACSAAACNSGTQTQSCQDYCGNPVTQTQSCVSPGQETVTGTIMNTPTWAGISSVKICATGSPGTFCTGNAGQPASAPYTYSLTLPFQTGTPVVYTFYVDPSSIPNGYSVAPVNPQLTGYCGISTTGPTFWYLSDAGVVSGNPLNAGSGNNFSQSGSLVPPGYNLNGYLNLAPTTNSSFTYLLSTLLKNARSGNPLTTTELESQVNCPTSSGIAITTTNINIGGTGQPQSFDFYCYSGSSFDTQLNTAINSASTNVKVLYPYQYTTNPANQTVSTAKTFSSSGSQKIIAFVSGSLQVNFPIAIPSTNQNASAIFIMYKSATTNGDLLVNSSVGQGAVTTPLSQTSGQLDGFYVFPGIFNDNSDNNSSPTNQLVGFGSLINTGTANWSFTRTVDKSTGKPAEVWVYQPKYITTYNNILSSAKFIWQELPPQ